MDPTKFTIHGCTHPLCVNPYHVHAHPSPVQRVISGLGPLERAVYCAKSATAGLDALKPEVCGLCMGMAMSAAERAGPEGRAALERLERVDAMIRAGRNAAARHTLMAILREHDRLLAGIRERMNASCALMGEAA